MSTKIGIMVAAALALAGCSPSPASSSAVSPTLASAPHAALVEEPRTISELAERLASGNTTAAAVTQLYLDRIAAVDDAGPMLNAVIAVNPGAKQAAETGPQGPLAGIPILIKDNIETLDDMPTTGGSLALRDYRAGRDAPVVARLRAAGAIILGKANLSEWANFRSNHSSSGWSGVGGQTKNPHALDRNPCGSSSGSGAAVAAGLAPAAVGTETNGSIVCPATTNGIVGIKPTVGLISRTGIIPISESQDTAGPMALTVADAALLLTVMAGSDPADPATAEADARKADYSQALDANSLQGKRIGVARFMAGYHPQTDAVFEAALEKLREAGAELVDITEGPDRGGIGRAQNLVLHAEFKAGVNAFLASTPDSQLMRTLDDLIAFNDANASTSMRWFGQDTFIEAAASPALTDPAYLKAKADAKRLAGPEGIDRMMAANRVEAIVAPTGGPAWVTDHVVGDNFLGSAAGLAAVAGYPHVTVPMGGVEGLPVGLSFFGGAWQESNLIGFAYAYEQISKARLTPKFRPTLD